MPQPEKNSHCCYCGARFPAQAAWPRTCASCHHTTYLNPLPVSVVLLPVDGGLLAIRRAIPPRQGELALPGGYIALGESWQEAGARELLEETGIRIAPAELREFRVRSAPDGTLLVFALAAPRDSADLPVFLPTEETAERVVLQAPAELAFPLHTQAAAEFFRQRPR